MRQFLLFITFLFCAISVNAQITSGDKLTGNIVAKDINGKDVDVFADLAAGKTVVIDVFATWCGPCWSFHKSGTLEAINAALGPNGTNQVRVYGIEGDERTALDLIYQEASGGTAATTSLGNWTEGVEYSIINDHTFNDLLNIGYFPTLYVIRPDKTVLEMGDYRSSGEIWAKAMLPSSDKDVVFTSGITEKSFCSSTAFASKPTILNLGKTSISSVDSELSINGVVTPFSANTTLGVFQSADLSFGTKTFTQTTTVKVDIVSLDGVDDEADDQSSISGTFYKPLIEGKKMTVKFTTDYYPGETSWVLKDNANKTIATGKYNAGNEDQYGGGGADANTEHVHEVNITNTTNVNCLTITLTDAYGDGMTAFGSSHPIPGVEFYNEKGELVKPKLVSEFNFTSAAANTPSTTKSFASYSLGSALEDESFVESLDVYPSPVTDILNVNIKIKDGIEYQVFVSDIMGKPVTTISQNTNFINVANLSAGMYFINVKTDNGLFTHKFTKL